MSSQNFIQKRTRSTFFTSMLVMALVLFAIGLFLSSIIGSRKWVKSYQEDFEMMVVIASHASAEDTANLGTQLRKAPFVLTFRTVTKEEAGKMIDPELMNMLDGVNPLPASFNVRLRADYNHPDSIADIRKMLDVPTVEEVVYPLEELEKFKQRIQRLVPVAGGLALVVVIVAFFIIHSTVRLAVFSKRLTIRSMQLVGATSGFIRRPFVRMGMLQGFLGALLGGLLLTGALFFIFQFLTNWNTVPSGINVQLPDASANWQGFVLSTEFLILLSGMLFSGVLLGWISSYLAVSRFLHKNINELV